MFKLKAILCSLLILSSPAFAMMRSLCTLPKNRLASSVSRLTPNISSITRSFACGARAPFTMSKAAYRKPLLLHKTYQNSPLLISNQHHKHDRDQQKKPSFNHARNVALLAGTGVALAALYNGAAKSEGQDKEKDEQRLESHKNPYETQRRKYYEELLTKPWGEVSKKYIDALQAEEKELMKEFFKLTGIKHDEFEKFIQHEFERINEFKKNMQSSTRRIAFLRPFNTSPASLTVQEECKSLLNKVGINYSEFKILRGEHTRIENDFLIVGHELNQGTSLLKVAVCHEINHILHDDALRVYCINEFIRTKKQNAANYAIIKAHALRFRRFIEKRADLLANLLDLSYVQADSQKFKEWAEIEPLGLGNPPKPWYKKTIGKIKYLEPTHPTNTVRAAYLTQLHQEMLEAIEKNKQKIK